jgi:hypothetical protein
VVTKNKTIKTQINPKRNKEELQHVLDGRRGTLRGFP